MPHIPGLDGDNVVCVGDVEIGNCMVGNKVIVAGGGLTGCETTLDLTRKGKTVTIVEMLKEEEMLNVSPIPMIALIKILKEAGVKILNCHKLVKVDGKQATVKGIQSK